jgi:hypothetical protein
LITRCRLLDAFLAEALDDGVVARQGG